MSIPHLTSSSRLGMFVSIAAGLSSCIAAVALLDDGHPLRIAAGIALFIALPGSALRVALSGPGSSYQLWEQWAIAGAFGLASSSLASTILLATGVGITVQSVALACSLVTVGATAAALLRPPPRMASSGQRTAWFAVVAVAVVLIGTLIGTAMVARPSDGFTTFAFTDPLVAEDSLEMAVAGADTSVAVVLESHELETERFAVVVNGSERAGPFTLDPGRMAEIVLRLPRRTPTVEIVLTLNGDPYRTLRLSSPSGPSEGA